ncbi:MAG: hypothetical protein LAO21_16450 [Acidobacteriia bacterium]|nr:hypothetical protein [Terriglobia bacterium]
MRGIGLILPHCESRRGPGRLRLKISCAVLGMSLLPLPLLQAAEKNANPLKQIEQNVRQADNMLEGVDRNLQANEYENVQTGLRQYKAILDSTESDAREYLETHRKTPHQFKDAEIKLRRQLRKLQDLRPGLPIPLRQDLDAVVESANKLRKQFMGDLFNVKPPSPPHDDAKKQL